MAEEVLHAGSETGTSDEEVVRRVLAGDRPLFEVLMRRHNQRLYRTARAILRNDSEAEDVMQQAYLVAFKQLAQFEGRAAFSTWLTKIAVHEALARLRQRRRESVRRPEPGTEAFMDTLETSLPSPEHQAFNTELGRLVEQAVLALPRTYRAVFVLREVEELSTAEAAECLDLTVDVVKTRLHRARALLREELLQRAGVANGSVLSFHRTRCDRVVTSVLGQLRALAN